MRPDGERSRYNLLIAIKALKINSQITTTFIDLKIKQIIYTFRNRNTRRVSEGNYIEFMD